MDKRTIARHRQALAERYSGEELAHAQEAFDWAMDFPDRIRRIRAEADQLINEETSGRAKHGRDALVDAFAVLWQLDRMDEAMARGSRATAVMFGFTAGERYATMRARWTAPLVKTGHKFRAHMEVAREARSAMAAERAGILAMYVKHMMASNPKNTKTYAIQEAAVYHKVSVATVKRALKSYEKT